MRAAFAVAIVLLAVQPALAAGPVPTKPCQSAEVRAAVSRFVSAFNAGDTRRLDRVFAGAPDFRWYSTGPPGARLNEAAHDRSTLLRYFARRHAQGERLELRRLDVNGNTPPAGAAKGYGNFDLSLWRAARRLEPTGYAAKGALYCYRTKRPRIIVWSMAAEVPPGRTAATRAGSGRAGSSLMTYGPYGGGNPSTKAIGSFVAGFSGP